MKFRPSLNVHSELRSDDTLLQFNDVNAKWNLGKSEETLRNINVRVSRGQLLAVIGPVGAGKSSLLQSVLGELATTAGRLDVRGKVSYACQEPWLFSGSVRQNITFGAPLDRKRYDEVVKACALLPDFAQLPFGDLTIVGERGSSLSGGQRARVNLARAVYREADIYLLDDPLSAVDTHVGKHLFEDCIVKFLAGKTRVLVTHQVQYLSEVSHIAILENGEIKAQGTFKELVNSDTDFAKILHLEEEDEEGDENGEFESADNKFSRIRRRLSRQMSAQRLKNIPFQSSASLASRGSRGSRRSRASSIQSIRSIRSIEEEQEVKEKDAPRVEHIEATSRGKVKGSMLFAYLLSGANVLGVAVTAAMFLAAQAAGSGVDYFVGFWTNQEELRTLGAVNGSETSDGRQPLTTTTNFVYIYSAIIGFLLLVTLVRTVAYFWICSRCSQALHDLMFSNVIRATMLFFNTNPSGRILNRFSKDLGSIDEALPKTLLDAVQCVLYYFGYIFVAVSVNWILIVPVVILLVVFYLTRIIYLSSAKNIKRLEGMTRSPIFTHLNATIQGLSTIRAFSAQNLVKAEFDNHQNLNTGAYHMIIFTVVSFGNILDLLSAGFIAVVIFSFVVLEQSASGGDVGLAITQCLAMTAVVQAAIRQSAEVASLLLGVERVLEYANLPSEDDTHKSKGVVPNRDWPSEGCLVLKDVWLRYSPVGPPVLKGLNFTIKSTEKVGIVGRTGAGKSSLISALFRLAYMEGVVELDGVDTASMQLELLRSRISIIPQDPVLFSGTLRRNLDPFEEYRDDQLWAVLEDVELRDVAAGAEGLQMRVADAGSNYSVGQRQLICLARAILRGNKLLMLDEATANVDPQTDALIQKTIRSKFAHCTVLTVAHRLNTIMDSDRVLVMDDGRAAEFDHPHLLIQKRGIFYSLVQQTGQQMADSLARIAREVYIHPDVM
ncbi:hypothetical protein ONE63_010311 [Megalurothrips usitatus]|uniref:Multidrug resistance-associated protein lethal(2)03659 n=1 Tax=Megalurothrips usitatus TaxID=439358 RepID=A0AAV7XJ41_9NEOP|nr:hypothetical protein ONE63_010311 [Megalurothrips usitatus]